MALATANDTHGLRGFVNRGGIWRALSVVVAYLAIYLAAGFVIGQLAGSAADDDLLSSVGSVFAQVTSGLIVGAVVLLVFCSYMGWTRELFARQTVYRSRWMWLAPIVVLLPVVLRIFGIDWGLHAADVVAFILVTGLLIGFVEELLYRGITVRMIRTGGHGEWVVAAVSSLLFALSHMSNLISGQSIGTVAPTVVYTFAFGVLMYLTMRVTGFLVVAMVLHGLTDPTTILATGDVDKVADGTNVDGLLAGAGAATGLLVFMGFILLIFIRGRAQPEEASTSDLTPATA